MEMKLCVDCRWYEKISSKHKEFKLPTLDMCNFHTNLITGVKAKDICKYQRGNGPCGPKGKNWEKK